ncbi:cupin domain-containing protein [Pseudomonas sp. DR48]|uniref:cupin domain-containing protein n=1 Tax=Pseudomonas sp. DR48 TaxID=2871095 RepID=UPI001C99C139|nr:cupin domain-containing protein [Pseudomonas sp. DR48]QZP31620.1 cupin domain-containing protein [Pseudomonas sp. DR48]
MPQPIILSNAVGFELPGSKPVSQPYGDLLSETSTYSVEGPDQLLTGIWECTPGRWRRQVLSREFSHFVAGHCFFIPDEGESIELRAGDAVLFPANCSGEWDIRETVRKSFLIMP